MASLWLRYLSALGLGVGTAFSLSGCGGASNGGSLPNPTPQASEILYAQGAADVQAFKIDLASGKPAWFQTTAQTNSTFTQKSGIVATSPAKFLYVVDSLDTSLDAFSINADGSLANVSGSPFSPDASYFSNSIQGLAITPTSSSIYVNDESLAQIAGFQIDSTNGALKALPNAITDHQVGLSDGSVVDPSGKFLYMADRTSDVFSGLTGYDAISGYSVDSASGGLKVLTGSPFLLPYNSQPTGIVINPTGRFLYTNLSMAGAIAGFSLDPVTGNLTEIGGSPFPGLTCCSTLYSIAMHPSGKFLYCVIPASGIATFAIDSASGALTPEPGSPVSNPIAMGQIALDPSGTFLYMTGNQKPGVGSNRGTIVAYSINQTDGSLKEINGSPFLATETFWGLTAVKLQ
jgi:6-phosphogluconolactonase (cycloisomerase 2 family)